jgi:hypothetical protein
VTKEKHLVTLTQDKAVDESIAPPDPDLGGEPDIVNVDANVDDVGIEGIVVAQKSQKQRQKSGVERSINCDFCEKVFKRRDHLNKHIRCRCLKNFIFIRHWR